MRSGLAYADKTSEERGGEVRCLVLDMGRRTGGHWDPSEVMGTVVQGHKAMLKTVGAPSARGELGGGNHRKMVGIKSEQKAGREVEGLVMPHLGA